MHELALTEAIIRIINSQREKEGFSRVEEIRLRIGEYSGIVPEYLLNCFPIAAKGTVAEGAALVLETLKASFRCTGCGDEGPVERKSACCPRCGSLELRMTAGREFYVESLKVE